MQIPDSNKKTYMLLLLPLLPLAQAKDFPPAIPGNYVVWPKSNKHPFIVIYYGCVTCKYVYQMSYHSNKC